MSGASPSSVISSNILTNNYPQLDGVPSNVVTFHATMNITAISEDGSYEDFVPLRKRKKNHHNEAKGNTHSSNDTVVKNVFPSPLKNKPG